MNTTSTECCGRGGVCRADVCICFFGFVGPQCDTPIYQEQKIVWDVVRWAFLVALPFAIFATGAFLTIRLMIARPKDFLSQKAILGLASLSALSRALWASVDPFLFEGIYQDRVAETFWQFIPLLLHMTMFGVVMLSWAKALNKAVPKFRCVQRPGQRAILAFLILPWVLLIGGFIVKEILVAAGYGKVSWELPFLIFGIFNFAALAVYFLIYGIYIVRLIKGIKLKSAKSKRWLQKLTALLIGGSSFLILIIIIGTVTLLQQADNSTFKSFLSWIFLNNVIMASTASILPLAILSNFYLYDNKTISATSNASGDSGRSEFSVTLTVPIDIRSTDNTPQDSPLGSPESPDSGSPESPDSPDLASVVPV